MPGPLEGVRVVDLTTMISGPLATMLLADQGADVVKIEAPDGDLVRRMGVGRDGLSATFLSANRGKRSVVLDLKSDPGMAALRRLVATADVLVQNFRPGTAERMGLGEDAMRKLRPDLIYVSISGFGETGPYAGKRVYDPVIQALSGLAAIQADRDTGRPRMIRTIIPDKLTAMAAAQAITAALFARARHGGGQHVRLAMLDAMIAFLWPEGLVTLTFPDFADRPSRAQLAQDLVYRTTDGYITVGAVSDAEWRGLCTALGQPQWLEDPRFDTPAGRVANAAERLTRTQAVLETNTSAYWLGILDANDVPCAPILGLADLLAHPQVVENAIVEELDWPDVGHVRQPRPAARFSSTPAHIGGQAPRLGAHTSEVLAELGYDSEALARMQITR